MLFKNICPTAKRISNILQRIVFFINFFFIILSYNNLFAAQIIITFDPSPDPRTIGHKIFYGKSTSFSNVVDLGSATTYLTPDLEEDTVYYFAAKAYDQFGNESMFSEILAYKVPGIFDTDIHDGSFDMYFDTVQKVYIGYYHRPADPSGLLYWAQRLERTNVNRNEIIEAFANSDESQSLYGTITSSNIGTVVDSIYMALFNRTADPEGKAYYVEGFNAGRFTAATIMLNLLYGAQNEDLLSINNKVAASNIFTRTIDPELDGYNFWVTFAGNSDLIAWRNFLSFVTWNSSTIPTQEETTLYIQKYIADPGDPIMNGLGE
jgi:hypothetical protein